jgi:hypothetical protein
VLVLAAEQHIMQHDMHVAAKNTNPAQQVHTAAKAEDQGLFVCLTQSCTKTTLMLLEELS